MYFQKTKTGYFTIYKGELFEGMTRLNVLKKICDFIMENLPEVKRYV